MSELGRETFIGTWHLQLMGAVHLTPTQYIGTVKYRAVRVESKRIGLHQDMYNTFSPFIGCLPLSSFEVPLKQKKIKPLPPKERKSKAFLPDLRGFKG